MNKSFEALHLNSNIINGLKKQGITEPTTIQSSCIIPAIENKDIIGESYTGSGKTLAYLLPLFEKIDTSKREMQALVLAPTHELALQIENQIKLLAKNSEVPVTSLSIIGDVNINNQIKKLKEVKPHIIVGSTGRILDLINKKKITAHTIKTIVIDECDNLLDPKKIDLTKKVIKTTMRDRQLMAFSASIKEDILACTKELMKDPVIIKSDEKPQLNPNIDHLFFVCEKRDKFETLRKIIVATNPQKAIVFVNNSDDIKADRLMERIKCLTTIFELSEADRRNVNG